jgi:hypothetical protein
MVVILISQWSDAAEWTYLGETYLCNFGEYGAVTIDTRYPGTSISIKGQRYPAQSGSYFYQTIDGKIAILFKPGMKSWTFLSGDDLDSITDDNCKKTPNKK